MSATGPMESPPQGEGMEAPSALPSATNGGGGSGLGGGAGGFECSLGLDEQVKNIQYCFQCIMYCFRMENYLERYYFKFPYSNQNERLWVEAAIERLRMDPCVDVQTLGLRNGISAFWKEATALKKATALHVAVMAGDDKMVEKILKSDFVLDIDGQLGIDECKYTALHLAAMGGNVNIMEALVGKGANPMLVGYEKGTILHAAIGGGHEHLVEWILGRYPSLLNVQDASQMTPLHYVAIQNALPNPLQNSRQKLVGIVKNICRCENIDMKALDFKGWSAFYWAVSLGNVEVVIQMLECGKDKIRLNEACHKRLGPPIQIAFQSGYKDIEIALMECEAVKGYMANLYRDRQVYVDSANAILVGAALIASVTFASWLQPPLNYTSSFASMDPSAILSPSSSSLDYANVEHNVGLRVFWVFNALSFYFAMATVVCGAATVIPRTRLFIKDAVEKLATSLLWTTILLAFSVVFVIIAFAIAGSIVVTPLLKYQWYMIGPTMVGGLVCIFSLGYLFKVVIENTQVDRIISKI